MTIPVNRRAIITIALAALGFGVAGLVAASDLGFTASRGALVGSLMAFNPLGALVTIVLAVIALIGAWRGIRALVLAAGSGFAVAAAFQLVQAGRASNLLGGRPSTFSFFLAVAVGVLVMGTASS